MKARTPNFLLALLSGILLGTSWYLSLFPLVFTGFVPLLAIADRVVTGRRAFPWIYVAFLIWNLVVTWWVVYASFAGAMMAFIFNSLFMAIVFCFYVFLRRKIRWTYSYWLLIPLWLSWEYLHTLWDLTWTWLTLGNVFSAAPAVVQWYEITGTSGGSLWILIINMLLYRIYTNGWRDRTGWAVVAAFVIIPLIVSAWLGSREVKHDRTVRIAVVQPNIDPYGEKFSTDFETQFLRTAEFILPRIDSSIDYLVFPETFISYDMHEALANQSETVRQFREVYLKRNPRLTIVTGCNSYVYYDDPAEISSTARRDPEGKWFDIFNTAMQIDSDSIRLYHKSKLVPGVERMPFPALFKPLESFAINLGGTMGSLGTQEDRTVFRSGSGTAIAPVICYESVYPDYVNAYVRNGAGIIFIVTNDGWWDDTPGYRQHLRYARLRAIETRRQIARSANTGISCFIDEKGNVSQETGWWTPAFIKADVAVISERTFFVKYGDLVSYTSVLISIAILLFWPFSGAWRLLAKGSRN